MNSGIPSNWCSLPFFHLSTDPTGDILPCCKAQPVANIKTTSLQEAWNSPATRALRKDFLKNEKSCLCSGCWQSERRGVTSFRQKMHAEFGDDFATLLIAATDPNTGNMNSPVQYLELKLSNFCNLMCRMCGPRFSSRWESLIEEHSDLDVPSGDTRRSFGSERVNSDIARIVNHPDFKIICFVGGEPFLDPQHFQYLSLIENKRGTVYVTNTNLTHLSFKGQDILQLIDGFKEVRLIVSLDGDRKTQEYIRSGINIDQFEKNLRRLSRETDPTRWHLKSSATVSALNAFGVPEMFEYALSFDLIPVVSTILDSPSHLSLSVLPAHSRKFLKEQISGWHANFDLLQFAKDRELRRVLAQLPLVQNNLRSSVLSILSALDGPEVTSALQRLRAQSERLDKIHGASMAKSLPQLAGLLNLATGAASGN